MSSEIFLSSECDLWCLEEDTAPLVIGFLRLLMLVLLEDLMGPSRMWMSSDDFYLLGELLN